MEEIWKDIDGFGGKYQVSNIGRVRNNDYWGRVRILKPYQKNRKYAKVTLYRDGKPYDCDIHRLVASAFIENPNNYPQVNHKDENKTNNHVDNLEWCSCRYNLFYGNRLKRISDSLSKPVFQYDMECNLVKIYPSARIAEEETGADNRHISDCCLHKNRTHHGYFWRFKGDPPKPGDEKPNPRCAGRVFGRIKREAQDSSPKLF